MRTSANRATRTVLRTGLIGCGGRGAALADAISGTGNTRLTMVMDLSKKLSQNLGDRLRVPWTTELAEILDSKLLDAVLICTPHHLHASQVIQAAKSGKHIMIEKPFATSLREAVAAYQEVRKAGVHLSVILNHRYSPEIRAAKALIGMGALGELFGASLIFQEDKPLSYWRGGLTGRASSDWRMKWETSGGGVLIMTIIHYLDLLRYLPALEIVEVSAKYATLDSPGEVEDAITLWLRYENGSLGTVNGSSCARGIGTDELVEFRLWGRNGHISLTPPRQFYSLRLIGQRKPGQWHQFAGARGLADMNVEYIRRFSAHVLQGLDPEISGEEGLALQAIVEAAYESARQGKVIQVQRAA
jgi:predicted dehydrogenase